MEYQGRISSYNGASGLYTIQYEDGDVEELDQEEVAHYLIHDEDAVEEKEEDDEYEDRDEDEEDDRDEEEEYDRDEKEEKEQEILLVSSSTASPSLVMEEEEKQDKKPQTDPAQQQPPPYFGDEDQAQDDTEEATTTTTATPLATKAVVQQIYYSEDPPPTSRRRTTALLPAIHTRKNATTTTTTPTTTASSIVPRNSIRLPSTKLWRSPRDFGGLEITTKRSTNLAMNRPATNTATSKNTSNTTTTNTTNNTSLLPRRRRINYDNNSNRLGLSSLIMNPDGTDDLDTTAQHETNNTTTTTSTLMYDSLDGNYYYAYDDDQIRNPFSRANTEAPTGYDDKDDATNMEYSYSSSSDDSSTTKPTTRTAVPTTDIEKYEHQMRQEQKSCRRNRDYRLYYPNCNTFHDTDLRTQLLGVGVSHDSQQQSQPQHTKYIGSGAYREAFKFVTTRNDSTQNETFVMKDIALWYVVAFLFQSLFPVVVVRILLSVREYSMDRL